MKCPKLSSYTENASTNDGNKPQMVGVYRGTSLDKESIKRRQYPTKVFNAGKKQ